MFKIKPILLLALCLVFRAGYASAEIETELLNTLKTDHPIINMEVSLSGQMIFALDNQGQLLVYNASGGLVDTLKVGPDVNQVKVGPRDDVLYLSNGKTNSIQILSLNFTHDINIQGSPFKGPKNAPVAIVVFSDFQCPYCARIGGIIDQVREKYPKEVKTVFKHFPLANHRFAMKAAQATVAADAQGKFWEYHDLVFQNFSALTDEKFEEFRATLKLDKAKFDKVMNAPETIAKINSDKQQGDEAGVRGTPTLYVNGRQVRPANPEGLTAAVEKALKEVKKK
jgi:protein-disulfide isomerase